MASVLDLVKHYQHAIEKYPQDEQKILKCIDKLYQLGVTVQHLQETGVGRTVNALRKEPGDVGQAARALVCKWKLMVASEESDQEGDHNNETSKYNGNGKDSDDNVNHSRPEYSRQENETSYESSSKSDQNDYKHMNGNHGGSKRKYPSSENEESIAKKSRHSSSSEEDYRRKTDVRSRKESSDSESDNRDTENSQSDSDASDTSEEETKIKIKSEPVDKHDKSSSSSKHSSYNHVDHNKKSSTSKNTSDSSDSKHSKHRSESKHSSESPSKERSHSSHKYRKEKEDTSEKRHKSDKESKHKEKLSTPSKHKSNSEKHRSNSQKPDSGSEKHKSHSKSDKHAKSDKHVSSSQTHKMEMDKHKKPSGKETSSDKHKSKDNSNSLKEKHSSSKEKSKDRSSSKEKGKEKSSDRHSKSDKKHSLHKEKSKDSEKKSKHENDEKTSKTSSSSSHRSSSSSKSKEPKKKHVNSIEDGIDCGSGASFAEALGMITPNKPKKKASGIKDTSSPSNSFTNDLSPAALLAPTAKLAPLPALEISALPEISPNYKPRPPPKLMPHFSDEDAISVVMSSKNQRTKVYSGNKVLGKIPSLYEMCVQILQEHIDALEFTGGVPYEILKPVVDKATPQQLFVLEHFNPYLMEDTNHLWQKFCEKHFRNKQRHELESWREMYIRCQEEQEHKLKSLTANIKIAQEAKKAPIKQTKMAYVDSVVKPPRNIARKQAQHGTAHAAAASPAARVASLASASNVLRGSARPSPVVPTTTIQKPKKAPLMQKALQFMRGRKR